MNGAVTITFSPCIDKSAVTGKLIPDKKLTCSAPGFDPGGGGINVARTIRRMGGEVVAVYPSGGCTGRRLDELMRKEGVDTMVIPISAETRENFSITEESTNRQFRFGMPGTPVKESEWAGMVDYLAGISGCSFLIASGSLAPGIPADAYGIVAGIAKKKGIKFMADSSGDSLRYALKEGVYLLKPNLGELSALSGKEYLQEDEIVPAARQIIASYPCEIIIVSMGAKGAWLVTKDDHEIILAPSVPRKSTVGAGDSMVGGVVASLMKGWNIADAARFGVACGTAATMNPGTALCKKEDADYLFSLLKKPSSHNVAGPS